MRLLPLLLLCACQGGYDLRLRFESELTRDRYERMEVALIESCLDQELGDAPIRSVRAIAFDSDETVPALGDVEPGEYGLYARAIGSTCVAVAAGCTAVTLAKGGEGTLPVQLADVNRPLCAPALCRDAQCVGSDAGMDGAIDDGGTDGGGVDGDMPRDTGADVPDLDTGPADAGDDAPTDPSLVAYYTCETLEGSMLPDVSGNGHDGRCSAGCPVLDAGRDGRACTFDGSSHFVVPYDPRFDPADGFTAAAWVRPSSALASFSGVLGVAYGDDWFNSWQLFLFRQGGRAGASFVSTDGVEPGPLATDTFPLESWHHLVWTYDGTTKRGYVNGELAVSTDVGVLVDGIHDFLIGADEQMGNVDLPYSGQIDEILIYDRPLDADEVSNLFGGVLP